MPAPIVFTRRLLLVAIAALTVLLMSSAATPATASAEGYWPTTIHANHVGWVTVRPRAANDVCGFRPPCGVSAYRWSGRAWQHTRVSWSRDVYAYPYTRGWHWIWTQHTGWLAMQTRELQPYGTSGHRCNIGYRC